MNTSMHMSSSVGAVVNRGKLRRVIVLCAALIMSAAGARAATPSHLWSKSFGDVGQDIGHAVVVDATDNIIMVGVFPGTVNFGGATLQSSGFWDVFVVKFAADGTHLWSQRFGDVPPVYSEQIAHDVAVDPSGNIYVTGIYSGGANFGGANFSSAGNYDIFLAKYNSAGAHQWSKTIGGTSHDYAYAVAANASGVVVTGAFGTSVNFGGGVQVSAGSNDIYVARYDPNGIYQWSRVYGVSGSDVGEDLAFDTLGNIVATGRTAGSINFGGGALPFGGSSDVFILKLNPAGTHVWSKGLGSFYYDAGTAVAVDGSDNVVIAGEFDNSTNLGGSTISSPNNYRHVFLAKYNSSGTHVWSQGFAGTGFDKAYSVAARLSGEIALTGHFGNIQGSSGYTLNLGDATLVSSGEGDMFVAGFDANGTHQWSDGHGGSFLDDGREVAFDASGNILVTGSFQESITFLWPTLVAAGTNEIFLVKYSAQSVEPGIQSVVDVGNDQGRSVKIAFAGSGLDGPDRALPVIRYDAYRRDDPPPPLAGAPASAALGAGWQYVASVPAHGEAEYLMRASTIGDSTAAGTHYSAFFIRAVTDESHAFFDSAPDSGYSIDNLSPGVPQNFLYAAGELSWDASDAADFDFFTVYGTHTDLFATATVVDYTTSPALDVTGSPYAFYFVTATDAAGNESKPARANALPGTAGPPSHYVLSVSNYPNPFNPRTTVSYTVPSRGRVTISIYDTRGALVATLFDGERAAGAYSVDWDGRTDDAAGAASGIYFARIEHASGTRSKKIALLK